jgi:hypothetical protein
MTERGIGTRWIERVLAEPELVCPDALHSDWVLTFGRIEEFGGRWLRVVYEETATSYRIVTIFFDRKAEKRR